MAPRSAVKVTKSPAAHVRERFQSASDLEKRLQSLGGGGGTTGAAGTSGAGSSENKANQIRVPLCEILSDILLTDPAFSVQKDVLGRLWRHCFYSRIGPQRARIAKEKRKQQQQVQGQVQGQGQGQLQVSNSTNAAAKLEKNLYFFLQEAVTLYEYLVEKLQSKLINDKSSATASGTTASVSASASQESTVASYSMAASASAAAGTGGTGGGGGTSTSMGTAATMVDATVTVAIVECLHRLWIHLGDLHRYSNHLSAAERCYLTAAQLGPSMGHAFNQLAVVCQVKTDSTNTATATTTPSAAEKGKQTQTQGAPLSAVALYWYCRSLQAAVEQFVTSKTNLARLFASNREWLLLQQEQRQQSESLEKSALSRRFLARYVDLHYHFFQGIVPTTPATPDSAITNTTASLEAVVQEQVQDTMELFGTMLQSSTLGDSLLCKLVTIGAFSECYLDRQVLQGGGGKNNSKGKGSLGGTNTSKEQVLHTTTAVARTANLIFGGHLVDRVLYGLQKITAPSQKAVPSVRLLLPLLLLSEYIGSHPLPDSQCREHVSAATMRRHDAVANDFWKRMVDVWNKLQVLAVQYDLEEDSSDETRANKYVLKEYQNLKGYKPFEGFIQPASASGYLEDPAQVARILEATQGASTAANNTSQGSSSVLAATQDSSAAGTSGSNLDQCRAKIVRFLNLGRRLARSDEFASRLQRMDDGQFEWFGNAQDEDDMDQDVAVFNENDQDDYDLAAENRDPMDEEKTNGQSDVLVFKQGAGGGPALLVPGALLQGVDISTTNNIGLGSNRVFNSMASVTDQTMDIVPDLNIVHPMLTFPTPDGQADPLVPVAPLASSTPAVPPGMTNGVADPQSPMVNLPPPASLLPPPGFGGAPVELPMSAPVAPQMPPGFQTNYPSGSSTNTTSGIPTLGESLHLFGGSSAMQTANPFATSALFGDNSGGNANFLGSFANYPASGHDSIFGQDDGMGVDGAALLDSSLLTSLWMDESASRKTKNPFAT
jgi:hypothetical protein